MTNTMLALTCFLAVYQGLYAWHGNGHYMVAYIAQDYLTKTNPDALKWANDLLLPYTDMCGENLYPFVEAAIWADKIKDQGWHTFDNHHFFSNWWYDQGAQPKGPVEESPSANAIFAINDNLATLATTQEDPYGSSKSLLGKSLSLRFLIHFVGDLHQPLHAEERITPDRPKGDMGGNLFKIAHYNNSAIDNLHFIWDEMFENYNESIRSNLPKEKYLFIKSKAEGIMSDHSFESLRQQITVNATIVDWSNESFEISRSFAYKNLNEKEALPDEYQKEGWLICRKRVALAGYRLGMALSNVYKSIQGDARASLLVKKISLKS